MQVKNYKNLQQEIRNSFQFPVVEEDTLILRQMEEQHHEKFTLKLFKNLTAKPKHHSQHQNLLTYLKNRENININKENIRKQDGDLQRIAT